MTLYRYSGLCLASSIPLPELPAVVPAAAINLTILTPHQQGESSAAPDEQSIEWLHEWRRPDRSPYLAIGTTGGHYLFRFWSFGDFVYAPEESTIVCQPTDDLPPPTLRHLLLDQVLPAVLGRFGGQALHASGVLVPDGIVAFLGDSGYGKSSLAASFSKVGWRAVADDCLVVQPCGTAMVASTAYPGMRLTVEAIETLIPEPVTTSAVAHFSAKRRVAETGMGILPEEGVALRALFVLQDPAAAGSGIDITRLSAREAFIGLRRCAFSLDPREAAGNMFEFRILAALASQVKAYTLQYPRQWDQLPAVHAAIREAVFSDQ